MRCPLYYKIIYNQRVIDTLDKLYYVKYQIKHNTLLLCTEKDAEAILSSDKTKGYHLSTLKKPQADVFDTVSIEEIDRFEYDKLVMMNLKTPEEISKSIILELMERGIL